MTTDDNRRLDGLDAALSRRTLLALGAAGAGTIALAACSSSGSSSGATGGSTDESSGSAADGSSDDAAPGSPSGPAAGSADGSSAASAGHELAKLAEIKPGEAISVKLPGDKPGLLTRTGSDTAVCFSAICPHQGCTVKPDGSKFACPCHGSQFEAATGDRIAGPAPHGLERVTVTVSGGSVRTS